MHRRGFIGTMAAGGLGLSLPARADAAGRGAALPGAAPGDERLQRLHPDAQTDPEGVEYFFLGNGQMTAAVQHATGPARALGQTPLGLMLWDPHHFARKWSTFTFHPEWGLERGMTAIVIGGAEHRPDETLEVARAYPDGVPVVEARWRAGALAVVERFWMAADAPVLFREVAVEGAAAGPITVETTLYHNHILFTDYRTDHEAGVLRADGYPHLELYPDAAPRLRDRYMRVDLPLTDGRARVRFAYVIRRRSEEVRGVPVEARWQEARRYWEAPASVETPEPGLDRLYRAARDGLRAAVSEQGRFDASIWQYNMEWVADASGVITAASQSGQFALAASVLTSALTRLTNEEGIAAHASRFHDDLETELNQQGSLLGAAWSYWAWSGDLALIRRLWPRIRRVAEFPLGPRYLHESGLLLANIELFERDASAGLLPGFDVAHQALVAWGLERAAGLARRVGDDESAARWAEAGARMREAMLRHPRLSLVDDGRLIKRRLPDGTRQRVLDPKAVGSAHIPAGSPLAREREPLLDPDLTTLYPILLGQVDPASPLARNTIEAVKTLWNESTGGYLRYHPSSDPDAPGGWTFPTAIAGRVLARAGDARGVRQVLDWFQQVQGGRGGAFFELYGNEPRPVPPLPPMGIIVWGWAEIVSLFLDGLVGARPDDAAETLRVNPHLPAGLDRLDARLRFRERTVDVRLRRAAGAPRARFGGRAVPHGPDGFLLPAPLADGLLEIDVP